MAENHEEFVLLMTRHQRKIWWFINSLLTAPNAADDDQSWLYLNGVLVDQSAAPKLDATESPRCIGAHSFLPNSHFFGDVAELLIYDTGLTEDEASVISKSIMEKYQVAAAQTTDN